MGNNNSTKSLWPPGKLFQRVRKRKSSQKRSSNRSGSNTAPPIAPMYDTVADFPVYSVVDKSRKNNVKVEDNVQYAEIEVIRQQTNRSKTKPPLLPKPAENTEYATINFPPQKNPNNQSMAHPHTSPRHDPKIPQKNNGTLV